MRLSPIAILLVLPGCFYGSEFLEADRLAEFANRCGVVGYTIVSEDGVDYLDLPPGRTDVDAVKQCIERQADGMVAIVRLSEPDHATNAQTH